MKLEEFFVADLRKIFGKTQAQAEEERDEKIKAGYEVQRMLCLEKRFFGSHKQVEVSCNTCGAREVYCGHVDLGAFGYDCIDNFWHLCLNCLDASHTEISESCGSEKYPPECPFCN